MTEPRYPGWVNAERANDNAPMAPNTLLDPNRIRNVRLISTEFDGQECLQRYEFEYVDERSGKEKTLIACVPASRRESFQDEVERARAERAEPGWVDPRVRLAG